MKKLLSKLDLSEHINKLDYAREKDIEIIGDINLHFQNIKELSEIEFNLPPKSINLDDSLNKLSKQGILHISEIFEFGKIISYFLYLKTLPFKDKLLQWINKIEIYPSMLELDKIFEKNGEFKNEIDIRLQEINDDFNYKKQLINIELKKILSSKKLESFLVDNLIHYIEDQETILLRGGFKDVLKSSVVARSQSGFFYVCPDSILNLKKEQKNLLEKKQEVIYFHCKRLSQNMAKALKFLKFINAKFDIFDAYAARVMLAKKEDLSFILPNKNNKIILKDFCHPALKNPKSINIEFDKKALLITGVNAGGKSMLLKSIISASIMAKYLLPFKINENASSIASFKNYDAIIEDPQNVKNDISTFAGRMLNFSKIFSKKSLLIGIDEIELGTDFEEAASLYGIIIENLLKQDIKIIITTHHKKLASLLAKNSEVELLAALYDEKAQKPKFDFLKGTIGKSYAFETALRYGISKNIVSKAREIYGKEKENLNHLLTKTINLELKLKRKIKDIEKQEEKISNLKNEILKQKEEQEKKSKETLYELEKQYLNAINEAKKAINFQDNKDKQRAINKANEIKNKIKLPKKEKEILKIGDNVKYKNLKAKVLQINKNDVNIEINGIKIRVDVSEITKGSKEVIIQKNTNIKFPKVQAKLSLDLHGLRADDAIEKLDKFISDALIAGYDEVMIYHGIGSGILSKIVKEFLENHQKIKDFSDAPPNKGGFGAKIVYL